ncbi:unnamed protein product [Ectocarpus sp. 4 AP-2014]
MEGGSNSMADSLSAMMYGAGDDEHPLPETVACMQQLVAEYVSHVTSEACLAADLKGNLDTECFFFAVRQDKPKLKRAKHLLSTDLRIKNCTARSTDDRLSTIFHPSFEAVVPPQQTIQASGGAAGGGGGGDKKTA